MPGLSTRAAVMLQIGLFAVVGVLAALPRAAAATTAAPRQPHCRRTGRRAAARPGSKPRVLDHRSRRQPQRHDGPAVPPLRTESRRSRHAARLPELRSQFDTLKPGELLRFMHRGGELVGLERKLSDSETLKVTRDANGFSSDVLENPLEIRTRTASATIDSSLFQAAADAGARRSRRVRSRGHLSVRHRLRARHPAGDRFTVVYEEVFQDGDPAAHRKHPRRKVRERRS